jgi:hypothetical protein
LYLRRYREKQQFIPPDSEYKLWIVSLMLADVELNDAAYAVKSWSQVSLIPIPELIHLRLVFLETIQYKLHVTERQYSNWIQSLQSISQHVSTCLFYKSPMMYRQPMLYQPLMRQPNYMNAVPSIQPPMIQMNNVPAPVHTMPPQPVPLAMPMHPIHQMRMAPPARAAMSNQAQVQPMMSLPKDQMLKQMSNYMYTTVLPRY